MIERDFVPGGKVRTLVKDLRMALELASSLDVELPHLQSSARLFELLIERGEGDLDCAAIVNLRTPS
jgi:3-hydroxyisobutyrate dehydrogenase-like beta-hydroxyacid dehydrogenase